MLQKGSSRVTPVAICDIGRDLRATCHGRLRIGKTTSRTIIKRADGDAGSPFFGEDTSAVPIQVGFRLNRGFAPSSMAQTPDESIRVIPKNRSNVHYLAAVYPRLQWSAEADETGKWRSCLENLFSDEELNLSGGKPVDGSFPTRLATAAFWADAGDNMDGAATVDYTPAQRQYIETWPATDGFSAFEDYLRVWARVFYTVRMDSGSARDVLLLFLQQNLDCLKNLFILGRDSNRHIAPETRQQFSSWVLDNWLPMHLHQYHRRPEASTVSNVTDAANVQAM